MKKGVTLLIISLIISFFMVTGCENEYPDSLWDPNYNSKATPVITSIEPPDFTFSGISRIKVNGQNFSTGPAENHVFFNGKPGIVLAATATQLEVKVPVLVADSITISVRVDGAYLYGYFSPYRMIDAALTYVNVDAFVDGAALLVDASEAIYFMNVVDGNITKIVHPDSPLVIIAPGGAPSNVTAMRLGSDGNIYHLRKNKNLYRIPASGGAREFFRNIVAENVSDLDFTQNGRLFAAGTGQKVFNINIANQTSQLVADYAGYDISAIRIYGSELYVAAVWVGSGDPPSFKEGIWKHSIIADTTLGPWQEVFNWTNLVGANGPTILSMTFDADGILYVGADRGNAITMINVDTKESEPLYPEILVPPATYLMWGKGKYLYVNRRSGDTAVRNFVRVETTKFGAPYYGRD